MKAKTKALPKGKPLLIQFSLMTKIGESETLTKYYYAGTQRIAMRTNGTLKFLLSDHTSTELSTSLGSTSLVTDENGGNGIQTRYTAWGEVQEDSAEPPTNYQYTGQYSYTSEFGLLFYNARWYDPSLGRFAQADTIVPGGVQGLDRYAYVNNNPLRYTDPTGHWEVETNDPVREQRDKAKKHAEERLKKKKNKVGRDNGNRNYPDKYGVAPEIHNITALLGGFEGGFTMDSLGETAENTYTGGIGTTGPVSGVSAPGIWLADFAGLVSDINSIYISPNSDVFINLNYSVNNGSISITSIETLNYSAYTIYLQGVNFVGKSEKGTITHQYTFSHDEPRIGPPTDGYLSKVKSGTNAVFPLYGTFVNPTNTFFNYNTSSVGVTVTYYDPTATVSFVARTGTITLPYP